jgi:hypothetical protein
MWPFRKELLRWIEPHEFCRVSYKAGTTSFNGWSRTAACALVAGLTLTAWLVGHFVHRQPLPFWQALVLALALSWFMIYLIPWAFSFWPSYILVFDDRIKRVMGNTIQCWKLANIEAYLWRDWGDRGILVLRNKQNVHILIGVPENVPRGEINRLLAARAISELKAKDSVPDLAAFEEVLNGS